MAEPVVFHVDMDAYFASVEQYDHPEYRGKPLIVAGPGKRGVVSACSYEARKYGVHSAMPTVKAERLCPDGIFVRGRMKRYMEISRVIMETFSRFSPLVTPISVDEAFLDMTGTERLFGPPEKAAQQLKSAVSEEVPITLSIGIAPNHYLAKIASDRNKPDGMYRVFPDDIDTFMESLPLKDLWGCGAKTRKRLIEAGLKTIPDIRACSRATLQSLLGENGGIFLHNAVRGIDTGLFTTPAKTHSVSTEKTLREDTRDRSLLESLLLELSQQIMFRLYDKEKESRTPFIKFRLADFSLHTAQKTLPGPLTSAEELHHHAVNLLHEHWTGSEPVRLIGAGAASVSSIAEHQGELFGNRWAAGRKVEKAVWAFRKKHGDVPVARASQLKK